MRLPVERYDKPGRKEHSLRAGAFRGPAIDWVVDFMTDIENRVFDFEKLRANAADAAQFLKALGNPDRLLLLCQLVEEEMNVGELERRLGIVQPTLSQQLGVLRREGLVDTRREGRQIFYSISSPQAMAIIETLHGLYCADQASVTGS